MKRRPSKSTKPERHEQWCGLAFVERYGLPDRLAPRLENPPQGYQRLSERERPNEWGDAT